MLIKDKKNKMMIVARGMREIVLKNVEERVEQVSDLKYLGTIISKFEKIQ